MKDILLISKTTAKDELEAVQAFLKWSQTPSLGDKEEIDKVFEAGQENGINRLAKFLSDKKNIFNMDSFKFITDVRVISKLLNAKAAGENEKNLTVEEIRAISIENAIIKDPKVAIEGEVPNPGGESESSDQQHLIDPIPISSGQDIDANSTENSEVNSGSGAPHSVNERANELTDRPSELSEILLTASSSSPTPSASNQQPQASSPAISRSSNPTINPPTPLLLIHPT